MNTIVTCMFYLGMLVFCGCAVVTFIYMGIKFGVVAYYRGRRFIEKENDDGKK